MVGGHFRERSLRGNIAVGDDDELPLRRVNNDIALTSYVMSCDEWHAEMAADARRSHAGRNFSRK